MNQSTLFQDLLHRADLLRREQGGACLSAPFFLMAAAELCHRTYTGITPYDRNSYPESYEEERVRLLFQGIFKASGHLVGTALKRIAPQYDADFLTAFGDRLQATAEARGKKAVSADVALLWAIFALRTEHRPTARPAFQGDFSPQEALAAVDGALYDYVITENQKVIAQLEEKVAAATAKRDWKPAAAFTQPEELPRLLFSALTATDSEKEAGLELPCFFGRETPPLRLTFCQADGVYYVRDNGGALGQLKANTQTPAQLEAVWQRISPRLVAEGQELIGAFTQAQGFFRYLQTLIFVAHGDLYASQLQEEGLSCDPNETYPPAAQRQPLDVPALWGMLKERFYSGYDPHLGLYLTVGTTFALNSTFPSVAIATLEDGTLCLRDCRKGKLEGEIFETFYFNHEDLAPYGDYIRTFCRRFGAEWNQTEVVLFGTPATFAADFFRYMNLAVLLSELGRMIELPQEGGDR